MAEGPPKSHESHQFPPTICPRCRGREVPCDLCHDTRKVSHFLAAAWLSEHPEFHETPKEFPSVRAPEDQDGDGGEGDDSS